MNAEHRPCSFAAVNDVPGDSCREVAAVTSCTREAANDDYKASP